MHSQNDSQTEITMLREKLDMTSVLMRPWRW